MLKSIMFCLGHGSVVTSNRAQEVNEYSRLQQIVVTSGGDGYSGDDENYHDGWSLAEVTITWTHAQ